MLKLEDIRKNASVNGIEPGQTVRIVTTEPVGTDALTVYYKTSDGRVLERMLFRTDELQLSLTEVGRPWAFDANGADFKLATEAYRINLAYLFDSMMAVHTSNVEPLPHQITAVYESMLPRQPLRYVLADDPGAGKTVMAGLYIRELMMRADAQRILIVAPGSLVEQWQDELYEKFGLSFTIFSRELEQQSHSGNAFYENDTLIARLDQLSRSEDIQEKLNAVNWDLVIFDEAHKLSATWYGQKVTETKRFKLGKLLGSKTRHFLLMTATPHNGKEEDFQLFLSLLDSDRFYGKFRDGAHKVEVSDLMRRMVKEELLKFDGTKLFPERRAYTANYKLSEPEARLYYSVTEYVKEEMNKADNLEGGRKGTVGFALTALQRRLASSPEAIYQSLKRRHIKLKRRVEEEKLRQRGQLLAEVIGFDVPENIYDSADEMQDEEYERFEEAVVDQATASQTIQELESEIHILEGLVAQACDVVHSGQDRKWEELSNLLQNTPEMRDKDGRQRKLIIFTEHKDTLNYLLVKISGLIGSDDGVVVIHGGVKREDRRKIQELFRNDPDVRVLLATDAAGEGINLQNANLMVNYDLPWNPNRLEQRFGRIHRIGQDQVCHLWNMVANETREGDVFQRLLDKLEIERQALGGRVFDILGEVFENKSLRELLIDAVRYGDDPIRQVELNQVVDAALDTAHLRDIMSRNALCEEIMDERKLYNVKDEMEKAEARKLQPYFIRAFFNQAFKQLGGELRPREAGRFEIMNVPAVIRERDRQISGRDRFSRDPVLKRYERVCFEKQNIRLSTNKSMASLIHPGHPLMQSTIDLMLEAHRSKLKQGTIFVDHGDPGVLPKVLFLVDHSVKEGGQSESQKAISRRIQFVEIDQTGNAVNAGWAPHLDLESIEKSDIALIQDVLDGTWLNTDLEQVALSYASQKLIPLHFEEIKVRRERQVDKTLSAVNERLVKEINYWSDRYPISIYYAFKQSETKNELTASAGWEAFLEAVVKSGLVVTGTWPLNTELKNRRRGIGSNALASSILIVCRKRHSSVDSISRREFQRELKESMPEALENMIGGKGGSSPIAPVDLAQATIGPGMAVFSKYAEILESDGTSMSVHTALTLINKEIDDYFGAQSFDEDTNFCISWFEENGWKDSAYGQAELLARAKGTSVDGVKEAGVIDSGSGNVRLFKYSEYPVDWNPEQDNRTPAWEALHQLIRAIQADGESAAGALLARMPERGESIRQLAYRLYTLCERKGWAEDARPYNELITAWHEVEKASHEVGHINTQIEMNL